MSKATGFNLFFERNDRYDYSLLLNDLGISLISNRKKHGPVFVDFCAGGAAHRRKFGGGKGQLIAKAVGVTSKIKPTVLDATAGLGGDAFVLACLGCSLTLIEENAVVYALLNDGLKRATFYAEAFDAELSAILNRMKLFYSNSQLWMAENQNYDFDVVYLDPMFPLRQKSAAVKKEMAAFHMIVAAAQDEESLLTEALNLAKKRVVVKRPKSAEPLGARSPAHVYKGKSSRFDVYITGDRK